jgi:hypothetical protein
MPKRVKNAVFCGIIKAVEQREKKDALFQPLEPQKTSA